MNPLVWGGGTPLNNSITLWLGDWDHLSKGTLLRKSLSCARKGQLTGAGWVYIV
jgi:hypothetical protein